jgi:hypothetical protein
MGEATFGLGWWQASNGKWYPPESHSNFGPRRDPEVRSTPRPVALGEPLPSFWGGPNEAVRIETHQASSPVPHESGGAPQSTSGIQAMGAAVTSKAPAMRASRRLLAYSVVIVLLAVSAGVFVVVNRTDTDFTIGSMINLSEDGESASFWATYKPPLQQTGTVITLGQAQPELAYESEVSTSVHTKASTIFLHFINGYESCRTIGQQWTCGSWGSAVKADQNQEAYLPPGITSSLKSWSNQRFYSLAFWTRPVLGQLSHCVAMTTLEYPERMSERCLNVIGVLTYTADWTRASPHGPRDLVDSYALVSYSSRPTIGYFVAPTAYALAGWDRPSNRSSDYGNSSNGSRIGRDGTEQKVMSDYC